MVDGVSTVAALDALKQRAVVVALLGLHLSDEVDASLVECYGVGRGQDADVLQERCGRIGPFVPRYIKDGRMYQIMDAIRFMDLAERGNSKKMKEVAAQLNEDSNPVLIEVILKK